MNSAKRLITVDEIEQLIDFIQPEKGIPIRTAVSIVNINKNKFRKELKGKFIYSSILPLLKNEMRMHYENSKAQAGENVGIITAQSFGQLQTQTNLNTFHKAGFSEKAVAAAASRFPELLNATHSPKNSFCIIPFKYGNDSIQSLRKTVNSSIISFNIGRLSQSIKMVLNKSKEDWYDLNTVIYNNTNYLEHKHCVSITFKQSLLHEYNITLRQISDKIHDTYSDLACVFSPLHEARIDVFVDISNITIPESKVLYVTADNIINVYIEDIVIPNLEQLHVCGIKGITNMFYTQSSDNKTWVIETEGTNFSDVLAHPDVDMINAITNDMWEIYYTLGIEACRQFLLEELISIMPSINPCHATLLVDKMTHSGIITSISRFTQRSETNGPLSKASFEESFDNLLNAGVYGERECTDGVSASIICGKLGQFGTGMCELRINVMKLTQTSPDIIEEFVIEC